jgi:hypothetical protein
MARATCETCGKLTGWRAKRGRTLGELRCQRPKEGGGICGGVLRGPTAGQASKNAGKSYAVCVVCKRRTLTPLRPAWPYRLRRYSVEPLSATYAAGEPVCGRHTIEPIDLELRFELMQARCDWRIRPGEGTFGYYSEPITVEGVRCMDQKPEGWSSEVEWMKRGATPEGFGRCNLATCPRVDRRPSPTS